MFALNKCGMNLNADIIEPSFSYFSILYCGVAISLIVFPLLIMKNMTPLIKINSYGIYFVSVLLIFVIVQGFISLFTTEFDFQYIRNQTQSTIRHLYLFGEQPSVLAGTLCLGYFSHSFVLPLMKNNEKQENNKRDLFLGYLCVMLTYIIVGIAGYIGFSGKGFEGDFKDNWFRFFKSDNIFILILRIINVFQLLTIFPILFYIVRIQFFGTFWNDSYPGKVHVILFSSCLVLLCWIILYFLYNSLGVMLSFIGAFTGLFLIYIIPLVVNIVYYRRKHPDNLEELQKNIQNMENGLGNEDLLTKEEDKEKDIDDYGISQKPRNKVKDFFFYLGQGLLICFGFFTLLIQFVQINMFGITIKEQ